MRELKHLLASASQTLRLQACTTIPSLKGVIVYNLNLYDFEVSYRGLGV